MSEKNPLEGAVGALYFRHDPETGGAGFQAAVDPKHMLNPDEPDLTNPAVYCMHWFHENHDFLMRLAMTQYQHVCRIAALEAAAERPRLALVSPDGGRLQ